MHGNLIFCLEAVLRIRLCFGSSDVSNVHCFEITCPFLLHSWHGTDLETAKTIAEHGFDERQAHMYGYYGAGNYFAIQSCKSHQYAKAKKVTSHFVVLLCRVTMGWHYETKNTHKGERRPPLNSSTPGRPYDSIFAERGVGVQRTSTDQGHHEFIVFSGHQVSVANVSCGMQDDASPKPCVQQTSARHTWNCMYVYVLQIHTWP
jgi:hypothetical protein